MKAVFEELLGRVKEMKLKSALKQLEHINTHEDGTDCTIKIAAHLAQKKGGKDRPEITWFLMVIKDALIYDKEDTVVSLQVQFRDENSTILFVELYKKYALKFAKTF
jgi:hypothetical protein